MIRYTITIDVDGADADEFERVVDNLLDEGAIQNVIAEAADDQGFDFEITQISCDSGDEDPEEEKG
jgi:hypothetical protein